MEFCAFNCVANHVSWSPRHIPNVISAIRILLVAPIAVALADRQLVTTIILFGVAALSDAADGFLAKRYGWQSELGAVLYRYWVGPLNLRPSVVSKFNTLCQAAFILAVVGREEFSVPPAWVVLALGALVFVTVVISGVDYILIYGRRALSLRKPRAAERAGA